MSKATSLTPLFSAGLQSGPRQLPLRERTKLFLRGSLCLCGAMLFAGCTTIKTTDPARAATEQLLLSTAADHALQSADLAIFDRRKVFLDATYLDAYDSKYALGTIRDALSRAGALLEENLTNSDIVIEARSGAFSIDSSDSLFGLPSAAVPVPLAGSLQLPQIAFYGSHGQYAFAKIVLLAFARESRAHVYSSGPLDGQAYDKHSHFLFLSWIRTDVPEKQTSKQKAALYQTWFPQYEAANLPATNAPMANPPPPPAASTSSLKPQPFTNPNSTPP
jgi:hypothetical protein